MTDDDLAAAIVDTLDAAELDAHTLAVIVAHYVVHAQGGTPRTVHVVRIYAGGIRHDSRLGDIWLERDLAAAELEALVDAIERAGIVDTFRTCEWLELERDGLEWRVVAQYGRPHRRT